MSRRIGKTIAIFIDIQKNNFAALSVGNGRKRPIPSLLPCEMNFKKGIVSGLLLRGISFRLRGCQTLGQGVSSAVSKSF
jgi:hypothetical protein